jgi:hypothetical protein
VSLGFVVATLAVVVAVVPVLPACAAAAPFGEGEGEGVGESNSNGTRDDPSVCATCDGAVDPCQVLVERACGACADSAGCEAARLVARYEPERCPTALADERRFPPCTASPCDELMTRVCGGTTPTPACSANPGCGPAQVLYTRATAEQATAADIEQAEASCSSALADDAVFAPCEPG